MAESETPKKRPRIRKTEPTVRERAAKAQADSQKVKPKRIRRVAGAAVRPVKKLSPRGRVHLPNNAFGRALRKVGRILKRIFRPLVPRYFLNAWREVRLVTWPGRKETWRLTLAVFIFAVVFGALVYGVDKLLDEVFKKFILK